MYGALRSSDGALTVVAINKTTSAIQTSLTLANFNPDATAAVYTYSNANLTQIVAGTPVSCGVQCCELQFSGIFRDGFCFHSGEFCTGGNKDVSRRIRPRK